MKPNGPLIICFTFFVLICSFSSGCSGLKKQAKPRLLAVPVHELVFVGIQPALSEDSSALMIMDPLGGSVFAAEPTPSGANTILTGLIIEKLNEAKHYSLIIPTPEQMVVKKISVSYSGHETNIRDSLVKFGRDLKVDAVMVGWLYRWNDRKGSEFAVQSAASLAFDLHLISTADGSVLWREKFDKTQRSLSENIFDLNTFIKSKGTWLNIEDLAEIGVSDVLSKLP